MVPAFPTRSDHRHRCATIVIAFRQDTFFEARQCSADYTTSTGWRRRREARIEFLRTTGQLYLRGLAALNAGKGAAAAAEFQKILDHKGRNWGPGYLTAYLGMARGEAMAGDAAKAKRAYQDFLAPWKDADKDAPYLIQATKELAALQ